MIDAIIEVEFGTHFNANNSNTSLHFLALRKLIENLVTAQQSV